MADVFDRASLTEQIQLDAALANQLRKTRSVLYKTNDIADCVECGEVIPPLRKKLLPHTTLCVDCQLLKERK